MIRRVQLDRDDLDELCDAHYEYYLRPLVEDFVGGGAAERRRARKYARRLVRPHMPFVLLAKAVFRDAGLIP